MDNNQAWTMLEADCQSCLLQMLDTIAFQKKLKLADGVLQ